MGTLERRETLTHQLGPSGRISVKTVTGLLRVRGIEGEDVHVTVTYRIRAADHASAERALESGRVAIDRGPDSLVIQSPERRLATGLAWLFGGARVSADIAVDVPWGAKVRLETMSGTVEAMNLVGDQKYRTASGEIRMWYLGGLVEAGTISGWHHLGRRDGAAAAGQHDLRRDQGPRRPLPQPEPVHDERQHDGRRSPGPGRRLPRRVDLRRRGSDAAVRGDGRAQDGFRLGPFRDRASR